MMKLPKTINQIYQEIKDFDLVLTSDAALATALNKSITKAQIGKLAYTPNELASKYASRIFSQGLMNKADIVLTISKQLNKNIKSVHNSIEKIEEIEKNTDEVQKHLNKEDLLVYSIYKDLPTKHRSLFFFNKKYLPQKVAVIEPQFFNNLDQKTIPEQYISITILTESQSSFDNFHVFSSQESAMKKMLNLITKDNEDDIAIVLNTQDSILNVIKSQLYDKGINIQIKDYLDENLNVRAYFNFISTSLHNDEATVKELMPFLELFNISVDYKYNNFILSKYVNNISKDAKLKQIFEFLNSIHEKTYGDVLFQFKELELPIELRDLLYKLQLYDAKITHDNFYDLFYYINNFQIELNNSKKGVLLADCKASVNIDKPVCFYLNPDSSWTRQVKSTDYIDKEKEEKNNLLKFQILMNQGEQRLYFAPLVKDNQKNIPCFHFTQIFQREINNFTDDLFSATKHDTKKVLDDPVIEFIKTDTFELKSFSQSSLNTFFECPKKFEFSRIAPKEEQTYFMKGTLLHAYAEFYVSYKEFCLEKGDEFFANILLEEYMNMVENINQELEKTIFLIGIKNIRTYIDTFEIDKNHNIPKIDSSKAESNCISLKLNKPINSNNTEVEFDNETTKLKGFIDLVIDSVRVVDYKSSKEMKTIGKVITKANLELIKDEADFQPLVYLLELSKHTPDKVLSFFYYFFLQNLGDVVNGNDAIESNIVELKYYPMTFHEFITSDDGLAIICEKSKRKDMLTLFNPDTIKEVCKTHPLKNSFEFNIENESYKQLEAQAIAIKDTKKNREVVEDFFKEIYRLRNGKSSYKFALFFKEDLDDFEKFVVEQHNLVQKYSAEGYPRKPISKETCKNCQFKDICFGREEQ
jgi:CRISPR/Cas system-associated exonuclease Cas4 (RecB family)